MQVLKNNFTLVFLLSTIWCILNEKFSLFTLFIGILISVITIYTVKIIQPYRNKNYTYSISIFRFCLFVCIVVKDIYLSAFITIRHLLRKELNPQFVHTSTKIKRPWLQALMGNAITLTPGTVTVHLNDGNYIVLWLYPTTIRNKEIKHCIIQNFENILLKED
jgi:multicomponent Na+:H+ antiporter subunit E